MHPARQRRRILARQQLGALGCLGGLWLIGGSDARGLGPYIEAVAAQASSLKRLALYVLVIIAYSVTLELTLRQAIQAPLLRKNKPRLALLMPATLYALTHLFYHPIGALYALGLGLVSAHTYAQLRDWRIMAAWHIQWNLTAITGVLALAMFSPGPFRTHALVAYKSQQLKRGSLIHQPGLGWVDLHHDDDPMFTNITRWLAEPTPTPLTLRATLVSQWGSRHPIARTYTKPSPQAHSPTQRWAATCSLYLDFNDYHERAQRDLGLWSGLELSAYQADDLTAVWRTCLRHHPTKPPLAQPTPTAEAAALWAAQALDHVQETLTLALLLDTLARDERDLLQAGRAHWKTQP